MRSVEKLWKRLRENLWESSGESLSGWWKSKLSTKSGGVFHSLVIMVEKFYNGFAQWFFPVNMWFYTVSTRLTITTIIL